MTRAVLYHALKVIVGSALIFLFFLNLLSRFSITESLLLSLISWTFFVICTPLAQGGIIIVSGLYLVTKKYYHYSECVIWASALLINALFMLTQPTIYLHLSITHLLLYILTHPWPYWIIIGACCCSLLYNTYALWKKNSATLLRNNCINVVLKMGALTLLGTIAYFPIVIAINTHGLP